MNTIIKTGRFVFVLLTSFLLLAACSKADDPFAGKDNYIASFSLTQGETVLNAVISDKLITVSVPEGMSLAGAAANVKLSENAKIYPDPASITNWNEEAIFAVTARNGTQTRYKYTVVRTAIDEKQTVVLETQADVDAFGAKGITAIGGNLVIGRTAGVDSIYSLAPLAQLKEIAYSLIVYPTCAVADLTGLDRLETVGGEIRIDGVKKLESVTFQSLKTAGEIYIRNTLIGVADFPALTQVARGFTLDCPLAEIRFPNLKTVGGRLTLNTASNSNAMLVRVSFPALEEAGGFYCTYFKNASKVELPELTKVGDMNFYQMTMLSVIIAPKLEISTGVITIPSTNYLSEVSFPSLAQAVNITVNSKAVRVLDFPKLKTVAEKLEISNAQVNGIVEFKALERIEGELRLYELSQMTAFQLPASIQRIGKLVIENRATTPLAEINIRGLNIGELQVRANAVKSKLIGDDLFHGTLTVASQSASYVNGSYPSFPKLQGFHEIDSLSFDGYVSYMDTVNIRGIRKINKSFRLEGNNIKRFSTPDLEEIGGNFYFAHLSSGTDETLTFAKLKKIGGYFELNVMSRVTRTLHFPALESVGGDFSLGTGYRSGSTELGLKDVLFPALKTIGGKMLLTAVIASTYNDRNSLLTNLDGFANLESVQAIKIINQMAIESFEGLKKAFNAINASGWEATNNNYNPTYEDLQNGRWTKP